LLDIELARQRKFMKKIFVFLLAVILVLISCTAPAAPEKLRILSEDYPPFNYTDAQVTLVGQSTEIVKAVMGKLGLNQAIEVMQWDAAYSLAQKDPGTALFSMERSPEREHLFMWVGPIGSYENWLYARKGSDVRISSLEDAKAVGSIAAVRDEAGQQKMAQLGFINFTFTGTSIEGLRKLISKEVDLWLGPREGIDIIAQKAGVSVDDFEPVVFVHKLDLFLAFNKNTDFATVEAWQKALDSLKK